MSARRQEWIRIALLALSVCAGLVLVRRSIEAKVIGTTRWPSPVAVSFEPEPASSEIKPLDAPLSRFANTFLMSDGISLSLLRFDPALTVRLDADTKHSIESIAAEFEITRLRPFQSDQRQHIDVPVRAEQLPVLERSAWDPESLSIRSLGSQLPQPSSKPGWAAVVPISASTQAGPDRTGSKLALAAHATTLDPAVPQPAPPVGWAQPVQLDQQPRAAVVMATELPPPTFRSSRPHPETSDRVVLHQGDWIDRLPPIVSAPSPAELPMDHQTDLAETSLPITRLLRGGASGQESPVVKLAQATVTAPTDQATRKLRPTRLAPVNVQPAAEIKLPRDTAVETPGQAPELSVRTIAKNDDRNDLASNQAELASDVPPLDAPASKPPAVPATRQGTGRPVARSTSPVPPTAPWSGTSKVNESMVEQSWVDESLLGEWSTLEAAPPVKPIPMFQAMASIESADDRFAGQPTPRPAIDPAESIDPAQTMELADTIDLADQGQIDTNQVIAAQGTADPVATESSLLLPAKVELPVSTQTLAIESTQAPGTDSTPIDEGSTDAPLTQVQLERPERPPILFQPAVPAGNNHGGAVLRPTVQLADQFGGEMITSPSIVGQVAPLVPSGDGRIAVGSHPDWSSYRMEQASLKRGLLTAGARAGDLWRARQRRPVTRFAHYMQQTFGRQYSYDVGVGRERLPFALFEIDGSQPLNNFRLRFDSAYDWEFPDRAEYLWSKQGGKGPTDALGAEPSVDYQDIRMLLEVGGPRFSVGTEIPLRFLDPTVIGNTAGLGDMSVTTKMMLIDGDTWQLTQIMRTQMPTGTPTAGRGNGHTSMEQGVITRYKWNENTLMHGELKLWFPLGGDPDFSGEVLRYGLGFAHLWYDSDTFAVIPTLEFVSWSILSGRATVAGPLVNPTDVRVDNENILNIYPGLRLVRDNNSDFGLFELGLGGGISVTERHWYRGLLRMDLRWSF